MENNNKLLADFLGHNKTGNDVTWTSPNYLNGKIWVDEHFFDGTEEYNGRRQTEISELKFHKDWNWLMLVVEKIESLRFKVNMFGFNEDLKTYYISIHNSENGTVSIINEVGLSRIEAVYNACVEFIKWYNETE